MVDFVLEDHCGEALDGVANHRYRRIPAVSASGGYFSRECMEIRIFNHDLLTSQNLSTAIRNREASLGTGGKRVGSPYNPDVGIYLERFSLFVESLYSHNTSVQAHLRTGDSDSIL